MSTVVTTIVEHSATDSSDHQNCLPYGPKPASSRMRRVASAPAFKHASAYQAPSAAAAVAQAQADAAAEACTTTDEAATSRNTGSARRSTKLSTKLFSWGTASSTSKPGESTLATCISCSGGSCKCLEVYVVSRPFTEFGGDFVKNLPPEAKDGMVDLGLCHYMTVFRTPEGQLVQFDFGPMGGDVQKAHGPLATFLKRAHAAALAQANQAHGRLQLATAAATAADASSTGRGMVHSPSAPMLPLASLDLAGEAGDAAAAALTGQLARQPRQKGVAGEIRERQLADLPAASMYMGRTQLSLSDIRQYNQLQGNMRYTLHDNDCRHYVNSLVQYATGVERSTQHLKRHYFQTRNADKWLWYGWFVSATQLVTDVGNWSHVQAGAAVTLLAVTGRSTLAQLKTLALPILPAITRSMPLFIPSTGTAAAAGGAATATGGLATTLKLPTALLLKRPLAGSAVAAAGGAGAAAAAIRTVPVGPDGAATAAAAAATSSSGASSGRSGIFGVWGRSVKQWGDGLGQGLRGAVLTVRRLAVGHRSMIVEQLESSAAAQATAGRSTAGRRGWLGRRNSNLSGSRQLAQVGGATAVMALPSPAAVAVGSTPQWGSGGVERVQLHVVSNSRQEVREGGFMGGLGHHVGRHVLWLGSTASRATGAVAVLASKQMSYFVNRPSSGQAAATAALGGSQCSLAHSSSSGNLLCQQLCQQQQQPLRATLGQRSKSAPSLAMVAAAAAAAAPSGPEWTTGYTAAGAVPVEQSTEYSLSDDLYGSGGPGSVVSSSVGGRSAGVGRQVLNLPAPRLSWARRASHAVIVGK